MHDITIETIVEQSPNLVSSLTGPNIMILNILDGNYYQFDRIGKKIWEKIAIPISIEELLDKLAEATEGDIDEIKNDLLEFNRELLRLGLIQIRQVPRKSTLS